MLLMSVLYGLLVVLGIGLVIFVHELGHFLAARAVGIRVEAFSIGFGPKLFGFRRGPTEYKFCLIPLGGYVKMAGEDPTKPTTGRPDEFGSKKVWQRTLVICAGVIMNMVFAVVALPVAFSAGVQFASPEIGRVMPGSPAWLAGLRPGDRVVSVQGRRILGYEDLAHDVAVSAGEVPVVVERDGERHAFRLDPERMGQGYPQIGVGARVDRYTLDPEAFDPGDEPAYARERARILKDAGLRAGDRVTAINGIPEAYAHAWEWELQVDPRAAVRVRVERRDGHRDVTLPPLLDTVQEPDAWRIGVLPWTDRVEALVAKGAAARAGLKAGDRLLSVDGTPVRRRGDLARALGAGTDIRRTLAPSGAPLERDLSPAVTAVVRRADGSTEELHWELPDRTSRLELLRTVHLAPAGTRIVVLEGRPAARADLRTGDVLLAVDGEALGTFQDAVKAVRGSGGRPLQIRVRRDGEVLELQVTPGRLQRNVVLPLLARTRLENVQVPFPHSIPLGFVYAGRMLERVVKTLRSIFSGSVSAKNLGGPITIFRASYESHRLSLMRGLLFMAIISINLAILNILPIPVLDGGWLLFLIIEKIKGSPVSESTMGYFQWAGLVFIVGLMLFVTFNDLARWIGF